MSEAAFASGPEAELGLGCWLSRSAEAFSFVWLAGSLKVKQFSRYSLCIMYSSQVQALNGSALCWVSHLIGVDMMLCCAFHRCWHPAISATDGEDLQEEARYIYVYTVFVPCICHSQLANGWHLTSLLWFRLGAHDLPVAAGRWHARPQGSVTGISH